MSEKLKMIRDVVIKFYKEKKTVAISIGIAIILLLIAIIVFLNIGNNQGNTNREFKKPWYSC